MKYLFTKFSLHSLVMLAVAPALSSVCCAQQQQQQQRAAAPGRPNVLFIAVDDLRTQLGCYGDTLAKTPNIDRLAAEGMVFNRAYCQQAVCNPSRASLMTGRRPNTTGVWDLSTHFRENLPDVITLPQYFRQQGYHTQSIGKIYHDPAWAQDSLSWSAPETMAVTQTAGKYVLDTNLNREGSWKAAASERAPVEDNAYIDGKVAEAAVELLSEIKDKPFFLAVGFRRPHLPFSAPARYWDLYERDAMPLPAFAMAPHNAPRLALHDSEELRGYTDVPDSGKLSAGKIRELIHGYYAATSYVDAQIGKVLRELDRLGLSEQTIVVLWSDHGYHLGEHGLWAKTTNYELDTRVPLIISAPGRSHAMQDGAHAKPGSARAQRAGFGNAVTPAKDSGAARSDALVELVDLYPTLVEMAGLRLPSGLEGTSMAPLLDKPGRPWKKAAFSQFPRPWQYKEEAEVMGYSVRTDKFRYTRWQDFHTGKTLAVELYDLGESTLEKKNLAGDAAYSDEIKRLSKMLEDGWREALPRQ